MSRQIGRQYYRPYEDTGETSSVSSDENSVGSEVSLQNTAGPNFAEFARQMVFDRTSLRNQQAGPLQTPYDTFVSEGNPLPDDAFKGTGKSKFAMERKEITTLFLVDSKNRDRDAYPQPTSFTLKTPRPYKNITSIQITQIKLLSSFFYFRASKSNITLPVIEREREAINEYLGYPLTEAVQIREGTYNINELLTEIQTWMNFTPLFYDFPEGGYNQFVTVFPSTGDLGTNFNEPGDTYYDSLTNKFVANPTKDLIVSYYWRNRFAGLSTYNNNQILVAYYYPVLYEIVLDERDLEFRPNLNLNGVETSRIIFNSQGLDDPVILSLIDLNLAVLDGYRTAHTFRYSLVNRYLLTYETNTLRTNIYSLNLNTSLINLFNITRAKAQAIALQNLGLTSNGFVQTSNALSKANVVFLDMYRFMQQQFVTYFAVDYGTYTSQFFLDLENLVLCRNGIDATGVLSNYTAESVRRNPISTTLTFNTDSPVYWPRMNSTNTQVIGANSGGIDPSGINVSSSMVPYNVTSSNFLWGSRVIDTSNYFLNTSRSTRSVDSLITVQPGRYTVFKFRSPARQTLQVETLPLPYYYRFADYNKASAAAFPGILDPSGNNVAKKYFDISYAYVYNTSGGYKNNLMDQDPSVYSSYTLQYLFGQNSNTSFRSTPTFEFNPTETTNTQFEFLAPYPPGFSTGTFVYNTTLSFVAASNLTLTTYQDTVLGFVYHDRGAFMADIYNSNDENPYHYIQSNSVDSNGTALTFQISTFAGHRYYAIVRTNDFVFPNMFFKPLVYSDVSTVTTIDTSYVNFDPFANPYATSNLLKYPFVTNYNSNFLRLPIGSNLQGLDPTNSSFANILTVSQKPIGYDISGVSNDLTDYMGYSNGLPGFVPNTKNRVDPLSRFTFQFNSAFDSNANTYFPTGTNNRLLFPVSNAPYTFKGTSNSEIKIVHWYDNYSIPQQPADGFTTSNNIASGVTSSIAQVLPNGFTTGANGILFGQGIGAIGFLPQDGLYEIDEFTFKSALYPKRGYTPNSEDPNLNIAYVGVYAGSYLANTVNIPLSSALAVLKYDTAYTFTPSTLSNTPGFGAELGTYYKYKLDETFVTAANIKLSGYTQGSNELLAYDSLYYLVPFNAAASNITYSRLTGSVVPYPLYSIPSTSPNYFGQTVPNAPAAAAQPSYVIPSTIGGALSTFGPQNGYAPTQSQYEQSQAITTTSFGFIDYSFLVRNQEALFPFDIRFSTQSGILPYESVGYTTHFTEYNDIMYLANSRTSMSSLSNAPLTYKGQEYASSMSTAIAQYGGTPSSIQFLTQMPSTTQNYSYSGLSNAQSSFVFCKQEGDDVSTSVVSITFDPIVPDVTLWMWGGGGATMSTGTTYGGAGAYVKAKVNLNLLESYYGTRTLNLVVGKGGNRENPIYSTIPGVYTGYEEERYGGGGTSFLSTFGQSSFSTNVALQGGGFTGLFVGSNLKTASTLLVVGGGGAAGATTFGGPGGFGLSTFSTQNYNYLLSNVSFLATTAGSNFFTSVDNVDNLSWNGTDDQTKMIDDILTTGANPASEPYLQPYNYIPTPRAYRFNFNYGSNVPSTQSLRLYSAGQGDDVHTPTGFVVYTNSNKDQLLASNAAVTYQTENNGSFIQQYTDISFISSIYTSTIQKNGFVMIGFNDADSNNTIQYSFNSSNYSKTKLNARFGTYLDNPGGQSNYGVAIRYGGGQWVAGGWGTYNVNFDAAAGSNWTTAGSPAPQSGIGYAGSAISATGKYQVLTGQANWISSNFGASWTSIPGLSGAGVCAISARGRYITVIGPNLVYRSSDYGVSFSTVSLIIPNFDGIAMSASGQYQLAVGYTGNMYRSTNFGVTWAIAPPGAQGWSGCAVSASGRYQIGSIYGGPIYRSTDFGVTWTAASGTSGLLLYGPSMSASGRVQAVAHYGGSGNGNIYMSTDFGATWSVRAGTGTNNFYATALSASGKYVVAGVLSSSAELFVSYDFGTTWTLKTVSPASPGWVQISISGSGKYMIATPVGVNTTVYRAVATDPSPANPLLMRSTDGINWSQVIITENLGQIAYTLAYSSSLQLWIASINAYPVNNAVGETYTFYWSEDGINWTFGGTDNANGNVPNAGASVRWLDRAGGEFWAIGNPNTANKKSSDGLIWTDVPGLSQTRDIATNGSRIVAVGDPQNPPLYFPIIYSDDGINFYVVNTANITANYLPLSVAYGNGRFVSVGLQSGYNNQSTYWSTDGFNWTRAEFYTFYASRVKFLNGKFYMTHGISFGNAPSQTSVAVSTDGANWSWIAETGGFNGANNSYTWDIDYGQITVPPNLSTIYVEFQKTTANQPYLYELRSFGQASGIPVQSPGSYPILSTIDNNLSTFFWPAESATVGLTSYPFLFQYSNVQNKVNKIELYCPGNFQRTFSTITIATGTTNATIYTDTAVRNQTYSSISGFNVYTALIVPPLSTFSDLYVTLGKTTTSSLQLYELRTSYDTSLDVVQFRASGVTDLDGRGGTPANMIDNNIDTEWNPTITGTTYRLNFTFATPAQQMSRVQIYGSEVPDTTHLITGLGIFSDSNRTVTYFSNANATAVQYSNRYLFDVTIPRIQNVNNLYIEFYKTTSFQPYIGEVKFFNIGQLGDFPAGYTGGSPLTMIRFGSNALNPETGGAGGSAFLSSFGLGGTGVGLGAAGATGSFFRGGSPAPFVGNQSSVSSFVTLQSGAGGGGGGYYGGGGGGGASSNSGLAGGAGGGGGGYRLDNPLITILEYGVGTPGTLATPSNWLVPQSNIQDLIVTSNALPAIVNNTYYGNGGDPTKNDGAGAHGLVYMNWGGLFTVNPPNATTAQPAFVDGSRTEVFQSEITYLTAARSNRFTVFQDPLQRSVWSNTNWVWYRAYLSLIGLSFNSNFVVNGSSPVYPPPAFPTLPNLVYQTLAPQLSNASTFIVTKSPALASGLAGACALGLQLFQTFFATSKYTDTNYVEMTEIYGTLDYCQNLSNVLNPHINRENAPIDRLLGGVPRFGYWPNPFLVNASYIGFDVGPSLYATPQLAAITGSSNPVRAAYGFVVEQNLSTGLYAMRDVMAYKPTVADVTANGSNWAKASVFPESYIVRSAEGSLFLDSNISVQPYDFKNAIEAKYPLFNYKVHTTTATIGGSNVTAPIHVLNDFQGYESFLYTFQNSNFADVSSIHTFRTPLTSTMLGINQTTVTTAQNTGRPIMGTAVSEQETSTITKSVTNFGFTTTTNPDLRPRMTFADSYYNNYIEDSQLSISSTGRVISDYLGNTYAHNNSGGATLYENICTQKVYYDAFTSNRLDYTSPKFLASTYSGGVVTPYYDFFQSKFTNIWHLQGTPNASTLYGARLTSPYDFVVATNFINQVFYPTHKIILQRKTTGATPITDTLDLENYPSYPHTEMFFYRNFSSMTNDISGNFAMEKSSNFAYRDSNSGYQFFSYLPAVNMNQTSGSTNNVDNYNYLAIRAYSPSEQFKCLVRFYLPNRYDFGYISLRDLSNEIVTVQTDSNVNPTYATVLGQFTSSFAISRVFGGTGVPGFPGSNISSTQFGDFLRNYSNVYNSIFSNAETVSSINVYVQQSLSNLILGDLRYILPSSVASRERVEDPIEFKLPFSTIMPEVNRTIDEYGMGYNLGFAKADTAYNTIHRAESFFKILDDYIYLRMNPEYNMNRLDISRKENFKETQDATAESQLYNCKLLLNNFGAYAQTVIQNPVFFNPPIGKLDRLTFSWYDVTGQLINNDECEWNAAIQIVERVETATADSTAALPPK